MWPCVKPGQSLAQGPQRQPGPRRRTLCCAAVLAAWAATACAAAPAPPDLAGAPAIEVAPGVFMVRGAAGEASPENLGRVGNAGFVVGPAGVIAIDSGTSYRHGVALLATIRRATDKPVRLLLLTHTRQEFLFGAAAFRERGIPVHMHARAARLMAARCEGCLKTLRVMLGEAEMQATEVIKPDSVFGESQLLTQAGRPLRVLYYGHSSGPGDIALLDENTGVLFAGGLLDQGRIPDVQDSDLPGWQLALAGLHALPVRSIVPGHGPAATRELIASVQRYLAQLRARAAELLEAGAALSEVPDALQLAEFKGWDQYDTIHRRNASVVFLRLEREQLLH
jgi:glyoxylase-like metal-dependent hydrolase (beta-lactamase superfamily II)